MPALPFRAGLLPIFLLASPAMAGEESWRASGFQGPESALIDPARGALYVSNVAGAPSEKDGVGFISRLALDGTVEQAEWVTGLDAPKGLVLDGDTLYVSDIDRLVAIDVTTGEVSGSWTAEGAQFLNDTAVDGQGRVFVSDMAANRIYVLEDGAIGVWVEGEELMHPNGLAVEGDRLLVAAWGQGLREDFSTEVPGHMLAIDLASKEVSSYGDGTPVGNLDGLEPDGAGSWLVTDWIAGALYRIHPDGSFEEVLDLGQGSADLEFVEQDGIAVIPMMMDGEVAAYRID